MPANHRLPNEFLVSVTYSAEEQRGVTILVLVSCISLVAVIGLLLAIVISAFITRSSREEHLFTRTHLSAYFVSLLLCNLIQAIASIMNAAWIQNAGVFGGPTCVLQGVLTQASDVGIAVWTMVISGHTFCHLFLGISATKFVLWGILLCGWSMITAIVALGPATMNMDTKGLFYGISGYWCWISPNYKIQQITLDRLFMFLAAILSLAPCILVLSSLRRDTSVDEGSANDSQGYTSANVKTIRLARQMLVYPVAYVAVILPLVISQFVSWAGNKPPFGATIFSMAIFLLSGLVNVILFIAIRPVLPLAILKLSRECPPGLPFDHHYEQPHQASLHSRTDSDASNSTLVGVSRKTKLRPPDIIITRDSFESVYDEEVQVARNVPHSAPAISLWSPDGSPRKRLPV